MDKNGRIRIPERMLLEYGLADRVMVLGIRDHLELRDPDSWADVRRQKLGRFREIMREARRASYGQPNGGVEPEGKMGGP